MRLKYEFEIVDVGDEKVAVPVGEGADQLHGVIKLNEEGFEIFNLLQDNTTLEEIISLLEKKYSDNSDEIASFVKNFINKLEQINVLC